MNAWDDFVDRTVSLRILIELKHVKIAIGK